MWRWHCDSVKSIPICLLCIVRTDGWTDREVGSVEQQGRKNKIPSPFIVFLVGSRDYQSGSKNLALVGEEYISFVCHSATLQVRIGVCVQIA